MCISCASRSWDVPRNGPSLSVSCEIINIRWHRHVQPDKFSSVVSSWMRVKWFIAVCVVQRWRIRIQNASSLLIIIAAMQESRQRLHLSRVRKECSIWNLNYKNRKELCGGGRTQEPACRRSAQGFRNDSPSVSILDQTRWSIFIEFIFLFSFNQTHQDCCRCFSLWLC